MIAICRLIHSIFRETLHISSRSQNFSSTISIWITFLQIFFFKPTKTFHKWKLWGNRLYLCTINRLQHHHSKLLHSVYIHGLNRDELMFNYLVIWPNSVLNDQNGVKLLGYLLLLVFFTLNAIFLLRNIDCREWNCGASTHKARHLWIAAVKIFLFFSDLFWIVAGIYSKSQATACCYKRRNSPATTLPCHTTEKHRQKTFSTV